MARTSQSEAARIVTVALVLAVAAGSVLGALVALLVCRLSLGAPNEVGEPSRDATVAEDVDDSQAASSGPLWLPEGYGQDVVCDRSNRAYVLVTSPEGGLSVVPYLDEDGVQAVIPQS